MTSRTVRLVALRQKWINQVPVKRRSFHRRNQPGACEKAFIPLNHCTIVLLIGEIAGHTCSYMHVNKPIYFKPHFCFADIDALGKPGPGILKGNLAWQGSFDECLEIKDAKYCIINGLQLANISKFVSNTYIHW